MSPDRDLVNILVVDDRPENITTISAILDDPHYRIVTANSGPQALSSLLRYEFAVVVLDVMMPYMDGFEVLQTLRKNPNTRELPVIMLTAKAQDADVFRGWQNGVDCYLTKPFNPMELIAFVKRIFKSLEETDGENRYDLGG